MRSKNNGKRNKIKINPNNLIQRATNNLNKTPTEKYGIEPETVEEKSLTDDRFREIFTDWAKQSKTSEGEIGLMPKKIKEGIENSGSHSK